MAYTFTTSSTTVNEGNSITVTVYTGSDPVPNGTRIPYGIFPASANTGYLQSDDFVPSLLTGEFVITGNEGRITLTPRADLKSEGDEKVSVILTGGAPAHVGEGIGFTIKDTSKTSTSVIAQLYVTANKSTIVEGQTATFNVRATNVENGTGIAYSVFGITGSDLLNPSLISGTATLLTSNASIGETQANISLVTKEDANTEGTESIVLLLFPDFPYTLELSSTIALQDTSIDTRPQISITTDKTQVIEGGNVKFTLNTTNLGDGNVITFSIVGLVGDITIADFTGYYRGDDYPNVYSVNTLANAGTFPALVSNTTNITLITRDDFIFEQTEQFYIVLPEYDAISSRSIKIIDSGNTLITSAETYTGNVTLKFLDKANLQPNLGGLAISSPFWKDTTGLLSENMVLPGKLPFALESDLAYYQPFSYVINSAISVTEWERSVKSILHPAGMVVFGQINNETIADNVLSLEVLPVSEAEVKILNVITVDDSNIDASDTNVTIVYPEVKTIPLTADAAAIIGGL